VIKDINKRLAMDHTLAPFMPTTIALLLKTVQYEC